MPQQRTMMRMKWRVLRPTRIIDTRDKKDVIIIERDWAAKMSEDGKEFCGPSYNETTKDKLRDAPAQVCQISLYQHDRCFANTRHQEDGHGMHLLESTTVRIRLQFWCQKNDKLFQAHLS